MTKEPKLAIIDAHALIHRAYHALPPMTTKDGQPTGAVYGFTTMLLKMLKTLKPMYVVAAFDLPGPTFRHKQFKEYKANRKKADDELVAQFNTVKEVLEAFNIPIVAKSGYEADDIIGTLVEKVNGGIKKIVVTGDKDTLQLIDDDVSVFTLRRGISDTVLYDEQAVEEKYGFGPKLIPDFKGLAGDPSDNIPGVVGIGEKTAKDLVGRYGSIEKIYKHLDELPGRAKTKLTGHKKEALLSRDLATIRQNVALSFDIKEAELGDFEAEKVRAIFDRLGFRSLLSRIPESAHGGVQPTLWVRKSGTNNKEIDKMPDNYHLVVSEEEQDELRKKLSKEKIVAIDTENEQLGARRYPIVGMSLAVKKGVRYEAWYVPVDRETVKKWKGFLEDKKIQKVGHNLKYDWQVLAQSGIKLDPIVFDTMIASYLLNPGARQHGLDTLAAQELGYHCIPITNLIGEGKDQKKMSEVPLFDLSVYACEDAEVALKLFDVFTIKIKERGLVRVMEEMEVPLVPVLAKMELAGVKIDKNKLHHLRKLVAGRIRRARQKIWELAGEEFNINSTQQLRRVLYEKLSISTEGIGRTQSGYSTAAAELEKLKGQHVIISWLEKYRELTKLQNTYIKTLPKLVDKQTGRIHTSFNQTITATGRLSSSDPNLQNIPVRTKLGKRIRASFVAERGYYLVGADYSQLELRIVAHLSGDEKMIDAFRGGEDIHRATAARVYGVELEKVTGVQRRAAKTLNFGVLYGMGPRKFSREAGVSMEEARSFIERYRETYTGIVELEERIITQAKELGFVETMFGRRRYVPEVNSRTPNIKAQAERAAFNFPIQGAAADILKKAMVALDDELDKKWPSARMVLTVHDELVCEVEKSKAASLAKEIKRVMEGVVVLDVPMIADVGVGSNWHNLKTVEER